MNRLQAFLLWLLVLIYVNLVPPTQYSIIAFFVIKFFAIFASTRIFISKIKYNLILSSFTTSLLLLQFYRLLTPLNIALSSAFYCSLFLVSKRN